MLYVAYLDEFGHIGPFLSRTDKHHKTSPFFGLGGVVLPYTKVRQFATWFYQLKCRLLEYEITSSGEHPAKWEKKGSALYTVQNVTRYIELRHATNRILNKVKAEGGFIFYVGLTKPRVVEDHRPERLYRVVLKEAIKRLDQHCENQNDNLLIIIDEQENNFRHHVVEQASISMFGSDARRTLLEPPIQAESHLYQTLQCADWICGLIGRLESYRLCKEEYPDLECFDRYFKDRMAAVTVRSSIRRLPRTAGNTRAGSAV